MKNELIHSRLTHSIVGGFYDVYNYYGYGLLESVYVAALAEELKDRGHRIRREARFPVIYKGRHIATHRIDMLVDDTVIVECKATGALPEYAERQLLSYLNATPVEVALLLHFGPEAKFRRYVQSFKDRARGPYKRRP